MSDAITDGAPSMPHAAHAPEGAALQADDAGWYWASPEKERELLREAWLIHLCTAIIAAVSMVWLGISGQFERANFFNFFCFASAVGGLLQSRPRTDALQHNERSAYRVDAMSIEVLAGRFGKTLDLGRVRRAVVWQSADGTPLGLVLHTGWFKCAHFWDLTEMPAFVEAAMGALPAAVRPTLRRVRSKRTYQVVTASFSVAMAGTFCSNVFVDQMLQWCLILILLVLGTLLMLTGLFTPRRPSF